MTEELAEDERDIELSSIQAIYPELEIRGGDGESRIAHLDLEISPAGKLPVTFDPPQSILPRILVIPGVPAELLQAPPPDRDPINAPGETDVQYLENLPPLHLDIILPRGYPEEEPPSFKISTSHDWMPKSIIEHLLARRLSLWEEYGRSAVVFTYIDFLQQEAELGFRSAVKELHLPHRLKELLLHLDEQLKRQKFEQGTFDCGICLEPKKGLVCHRLSTCHHVFCIGCLQDFYSSAITEGDVGKVKCLSPECGKDKKRKHRTLHPRELLAIPLDRTQVQRYVDMKLKKKLESDKTMVYCPRKFCRAPARSAKYAKYNSADLESYPESDSEAENDSAPPVQAAAAERSVPEAWKPPQDRLSICSKCSYAFCRICEKSWHGDLSICRPANSTLESLSAEEAASFKYIRLNTSPCPTCNSPSQKTHGCNHMICAVCETHFCYLCSSWLDSGNPYKHFNTIGTECYMRLWELEEGDEGDPDEARPAAHFGGPRAAEQAVEFAAMLQRNAAGPEDAALGRIPAALAPPPPAPMVRALPAAMPMRPAAARPPGRDAVRGPARVAARHPARGPAGGGPAGRAAPRAGAPRVQPDPALQRFLEMAANDEEDGWDSDEMEIEFD